VPGYEFDVFISYARRGSAQKWLLNHFYPKLKDCLADQIAPVPKVYIDRSMPRGVHWPSNLRKTLRHTKIIVPVFTPQYFASPWCLAELHSMREREKILGLGGLEVPQGLIYPILYSDSDSFPDEARERSWFDFKGLDMPEPVFQESRLFERFHKLVVEMAEDIARLLKQIPEWQADWPIIDPPDPLLLPPPLLPRFDR
jgi:hypothetical protein